MTTRLLVVGATSAIAHAVARRYASEHASIYLIARNGSGLTDNAADLSVRGAASVGTAILDALDMDRHDAVLDAAFASFGGFDAALVAWGVLPDQGASQRSAQAALISFDINARAVIAVLTALANRFESQGSGVIAVLSSPAGDRGRASNYVYGAAKAAVSTFSSGLRHRLRPTGVRVLTIEPGFVDTPMTSGFEKGILWTTPDRVAVDIKRALKHGFGVVYTPWFWRWIMVIIRALPERLFVRTSL
jgi:decaprenylphospho-beta-D-erythro-pentofuranosid-2-ulose 2-reductase